MGISTWILKGDLGGTPQHTPLMRQVKGWHSRQTWSLPSWTGEIKFLLYKGESHPKRKASADIVPCTPLSTVHLLPHDYSRPIMPGAADEASEAVRPSHHPASRD